MKKKSLQLSGEGDRERQSERLGISDITGIIFATIVVGFTVANNQNLRDEIIYQIQSVLSVTRDIISQVRFVVDRIVTINRLVNADKTEAASTAQSVDKGKPVKALALGDSDSLIPRGNNPVSGSKGLSLQSEMDSKRKVYEEYDSFWQRFIESNKE